jgi:hypothetical protein
MVAMKGSERLSSDCISVAAYAENPAKFCVKPRLNCSITPAGRKGSGAGVYRFKQRRGFTLH